MIVRIVFDEYTPVIENAIIKDFIGLSSQYKEFDISIQDPSQKLGNLIQTFHFEIDSNEIDPDLQIVYTVNKNYPYDLVESNVETIHRNFNKEYFNQKLTKNNLDFKKIPHNNSIGIKPQEPIHQTFVRPIRNAPAGIDPLSLRLWGSHKEKEE